MMETYNMEEKNGRQLKEFHLNAEDGHRLLRELSATWFKSFHGHDENVIHTNIDDIYCAGECYGMKVFIHYPKS